MPARRISDSPSEAELTFENALSKLESIVEAMENEQLPLEDLVSQYESGSLLLKHCESILTSARKRIELITLTNRDEPGPDSQDENFHLPADSNSADTEDENDITLF
ncbi:MAG: exodeoxyribonuclease VII small subunit [Armatimonadetes bacterium]|nr:exodeoxyribonuclease VII small subunit [Akkermansiaceae bacterium]